MDARARHGHKRWDKRANRRGGGSHRVGCDSTLEDSRSVTPASGKGPGSIPCGEGGPADRLCSRAPPSPGSMIRVFIATFSPLRKDRTAAPSWSARADHASRYRITYVLTASLPMRTRNPRATCRPYRDRHRVVHQENTYSRPSRIPLIGNVDTGRARTGQSAVSRGRGLSVEHSKGQTRQPSTSICGFGHVRI
jgi:hypothetical protein